MLTALLLCSLLVYTHQIPDTCVLTGKVVERDSGEPLIGANVLLVDLKGALIQGTVTDFNGDYCFTNIPEGSYTVEASYTGFEASKIEGVPLVPLKQSKLDFTLSAGQMILSEIVVTSDSKVKRALNNLKSMTIRKEYAEADMSMNSTHSRYVEDEIVIPTSESYTHLEENTFKAVKNEPLSTLSIDVDKASYSNVRRFINSGMLPPVDAVRIEEMINYFEYDYPQPTGKDPFSISMEYTDAPWNKKHKLVHIGLKGYEVPKENLPPNNLVFLIDVSGSMSSPQKLGLVKSGLKLLVDQLGQNDKIAITVYAGAAGLVLPSTSGDQKTKIIDAIDRLSAGGSTAGGAGIKLAYKTAKDNFIEQGNNRVILATDGDFNVGVSNEGGLIKLIEEKREDDIFLSVLGFGTGNYQDSKMEALADHGNGNYAYIDNMKEARKVLVTEAQGTLLTIAKDVKIQIEFNPDQVQEYRLIGYENRKLNNEDFNDDKKDAGELGAGHTVTALYEIVPVGANLVTTEIDPLKYQKPLKNVKSMKLSKDILTIKFRYKEPTGTTSKLISDTLIDENLAFDESSENCRFSSAVASFGMILKDSEFKAETSFDHVLSMAKRAKGTDTYGYRSEFIELVKMTKKLSK